MFDKSFSCNIKNYDLFTVESVHVFPLSADKG